jgi:hypothetical protein
VCEQWMSPIAHHKYCLGRTLYKARARAKEKSLPCNIDLAHLLTIFPADRLCPALNVPMVWGIGMHDSTPALDRKVPSRGYVRGNVAFISNLANQIKSSATTEQVLAVANYLKG